MRYIDYTEHVSRRVTVSLITQHGSSKHPVQNIKQLNALCIGILLVEAFYNDLIHKFIFK